MSAFYYSLRYAIQQALSVNRNNNKRLQMNNDSTAITPATPTTYTTTNPADAVALLNERLAAEADAFTHATGLKLAAVKVKRDRESDDYRLECHVRS